MSSRRRWPVAVLLALVLLGVGLVAARNALPRLVEWGLPRAADRLGVDDLRVTAESLRWGELVLVDVKAGKESELAADAIRVRFGPGGLRRGRLDRVEVENLRVRARVGDDGLSLAPIERFLAAPAPQPPPRVPTLATRELLVRHVDVEVRSGEEVLTLELDGEIAFRVEGSALVIQAPLEARVVGAALDLLAAGDVRVRGAVDYAGGGPLPDLRIDLEDWSAALADLVLEDLAGGLHFSGLPPVTPEPQRLELGRLASGAELRDGLVVFSLDAAGAVDLHEARFSAFGGTLRARGRFEPAASAQRFTLEARGIDLESLLEEAEVAGLAGTGRFDATAVVEISEAGVRISGGDLASKQDGGWVRYRPPGRPALDYAAPQGLDLVQTALDNFQYRSLGGTLAGDAGGDLKLALRIEGANPDLYDGHPIKLDLNLNGPFLGLMRSSRTLTGVPESLERRLGEELSR